MRSISPLWRGQSSATAPIRTTATAPPATARRRRARCSDRATAGTAAVPPRGRAGGRSARTIPPRRRGSTAFFSVRGGSAAGTLASRLVTQTMARRRSPHVEQPSSCSTTAAASFSAGAPTESRAMSARPGQSTRPTRVRRTAPMTCSAWSMAAWTETEDRPGATPRASLSSSPSRSWRSARSRQPLCTLGPGAGSRPGSAVAAPQGIRDRAGAGQRSGMAAARHLGRRRRTRCREARPQSPPGRRPRGGRNRLPDGRHGPLGVAGDRQSEVVEGVAMFLEKAAHDGRA